MVGVVDLVDVDGQLPVVRGHADLDTGDHDRAAGGSAGTGEDVGDRDHAAGRPFDGFVLLTAAGAGEQHPVAEELAADRLEAVALVEAGGSSVVGDQPQVVGCGVGDDLAQQGGTVAVALRVGPHRVQGQPVLSVQVGVGAGDVGAAVLGQPPVRGVLEGVAFQDLTGQQPRREHQGRRRAGRTRRRPAARATRRPSSATGDTVIGTAGDRDHPAGGPLERVGQKRGELDALLCSSEDAGLRLQLLGGAHRSSALSV